MKKLSALLFLLFVSTLTACGASPEDVCEKQAKLLEDEGIEISDEELKECVSDQEKKKEIKGIFGYKDYSNCVMDADNIEAALKCE